MEFSPQYVVNAPSVDSFKNRLDKQWSNEEIVYDYKAAAPAGRKIYAPAGTQDLTIEAKACGHEDTYVNLGIRVHCMCCLEKQERTTPYNG